MPYNAATKRRYRDPGHPRRIKLPWYGMPAGAMVFHHILNLFAAHRAERERWSGRVAQTARYREWIARRDNQ